MALGNDSGSVFASLRKNVLATPYRKDMRSQKVR